MAIPPPHRKFALRKSGTALLRSSVLELLVQKFISGDTTILKNLGFQCRSVEEFMVAKYDDGLLLLLREELQKPSPAPNTSLRAALLKARFSDTITAKAGGVDAAASTSENCRKRKWADEILESEKKFTANYDKYVDADIEEGEIIDSDPRSSIDSRRTEQRKVLPSELRKTRFSAKVAAASTSENCRMRKRADKILESEKEFIANASDYDKYVDADIEEGEIIDSDPRSSIDARRTEGRKVLPGELRKARFSNTITANDAAASTSENSRRQKRAEETKRQKIAEMRTAARAELDKVEKEEGIWPEDNFWAMRQFDLLIRTAAPASKTLCE